MGTDYGECETFRPCSGLKELQCIEQTEHKLPDILEEIRKRFWGNGENKSTQTQIHTAFVVYFAKEKAAEHAEPCAMCDFGMH